MSTQPKSLNSISFFFGGGAIFASIFAVVWILGFLSGMQYETKHILYYDHKYNDVLISLVNEANWEHKKIDELNKSTEKFIVKK